MEAKATETSSEIRKQKLLVEFDDINKNNYQQLLQLNNMCLPVRYGQGFYARILHKMRFGKFAFYNDLIVGAISWKYDICEGVRSIYIMTITVLEEYRRYYIGSQLLTELINIHKNTNEVKYINLHVQISNQAALKFYLKHNFENMKIVENYYTDIEPKDAYYLKLIIHE